MRLSINFVCINATSKCSLVLDNVVCVWKSNPGHLDYLEYNKYLTETLGYKVEAWSLKVEGI